MDYKLAKKLKDAGFPQEGDRVGDIISGGDTLGERIYYPTLTELIEACGREFRQLRKIIDIRDDSTSWKAKSKFFEVRKLKSPEEAIAILWLKMNEKI